MALSLPNESRSTFRADLNTILTLLASGSVGTTAPSAPETGRLWLDSTGSTSWSKKRWSGSAWIVEGTYDISGGTFTPAGAGVGVPSGVELSFPGNGSVPTGFLLCDGTTYLKSDYSALATALGSKYSVDGTHFKVPDRRGRALFGRTDMGGSDSGLIPSGTDLATTGGAATVTLAAGQIPQLTGVTRITSTAEYGAPGETGGPTALNGSDTGGTVGSATPTVVDKMPPFGMTNWIIKT